MLMVRLMLVDVLDIVCTFHQILWQKNNHNKQNSFT